MNCDSNLGFEIWTSTQNELLSGERAKWMNNWMINEWKINGNQWKCIENKWKSKEIHEKLVKMHNFHWNVTQIQLLRSEWTKWMNQW